MGNGNGKFCYVCNKRNVGAVVGAALDLLPSLAGISQLIYLSMI